MQDIGDKTKKKLLEEIRMRINALLKEKKISQKALVVMCQKAGFDITQPEVSRLMNEKGTINLYQVIAFAQALNIPMDRLIEGNVEQPTVQLEIFGDKFLTDPSSAKEFTSLLGKYHVIFHSTAADEDKILEGELSFSALPSKKICQAAFRLDTGDRDAQGNAVYKDYQGQMLIAKSVDTAYCLLASEQIGELCMIEFRYRNFQVRKLSCRLGMVMTVSAGDVKQPSVHKMFFSRTPLNGKARETIIQMLRMNADRFLVSRQTLLDIWEKYPEFSPACNELLKRDCKEYMEVSAGVVEMSTDLNRKKMIEFMSLIGKIEGLPYTIALKAQEDQFSHYIYSLDDSND